MVSSIFSCTILFLTLLLMSLTISKYGIPGFTINMSAPSTTSRSYSKKINQNSQAIKSVWPQDEKDEKSNVAGIEMALMVVGQFF